MSEELKLRDDRQPHKISLDEMCEKALLNWGFDTQMDMAIEEMSELIKAILKFRRDPTEMRARHLAEEMVDVKIMLRQVEIAMTDKCPDFEKWEEQEQYLKLFRLEGMITKYTEYKNQP